MSEEITVKVDNIEKPKKKGGCLQGCLTILIIFVAFGAIIGACFGNEDEEEKAPATANVEENRKKEESVKEEVTPTVEEKEVKVENPVVATWQEKVKEIAIIDGSPTDKYDAIMLYAKEYSPTDSEIAEFEKYIIDEYQNKRYIADINNSEYMIGNIFRANVINRFYGQVNSPLNNFAFDFYQNTKYTYRGVDAIDSDAVRSNERQMDKALKKM